MSEYFQCLKYCIVSKEKLMMPSNPIDNWTVLYHTSLVKDEMPFLNYYLTLCRIAKKTKTKQIYKNKLNFFKSI